MKDDRVEGIEVQGPGSILEEIARRGAPQMLAAAMEDEVAEFLAQHADKRDPNGRRVCTRQRRLRQRTQVAPTEQSDLETCSGRST